MTSTFRSGSAPGSSRQNKLFNHNNNINSNNINITSLSRQNDTLYNKDKPNRKQLNNTKLKVPSYRQSITRVGNSGGTDQLADLNAALRNSFSIQDESSYKLDMNHFTNTSNKKNTVSPSNRQHIQRDFTSTYASDILNEVDTSNHDWLRLYSPKTDGNKHIDKNSKSKSRRGGKGSKKKHSSVNNNKNSNSSSSSSSYERRKLRKGSNTKRSSKRSSSNAPNNTHEWTSVHRTTFSPESTPEKLNFGFKPMHSSEHGTSRNFTSRRKNNANGSSSSASSKSSKRNSDNTIHSNFSFDEFNVLSQEQRRNTGNSFNTNHLFNDEEKSNSKEDKGGPYSSDAYDELDDDSDSDYRFNAHGKNDFGRKMDAPSNYKNNIASSFFSDDTQSNAENDSDSKADDDELSISKEMNLKAQLYAAIEGGDSTANNSDASGTDTSRPNSQQRPSSKRSNISLNMNSRPSSNDTSSNNSSNNLPGGALSFSIPYENSTTIDVLRRENERLKRMEAEENMQQVRGSSNSSDNGEDVLYAERGKSKISVTKVNSSAIKKKKRAASKKKTRTTKLDKIDSSKNSSQSSNKNAPLSTITSDVIGKEKDVESTANNWETEAQAVLQKRLDGLLQTTEPTSASNKKASVQKKKLINASPITKSVSPSGEFTRSKHRIRSAKISRGSQAQHRYNKDKERREKIKKSRHKSANIVEHRKRMKKIWEQHHNLQRPPSRQRTPFPTHLAEFEFKRFQAFGKENPAKNKVPTDPIAKSQIMRARKVAEESPRPPSRHRPPGESLFLNESENRSKQQQERDDNNSSSSNTPANNAGHDASNILYVDDLIMASKQSSSTSEDDQLNNSHSSPKQNDDNDTDNSTEVVEELNIEDDGKNSSDNDEIELNISKAWKRHKNHQSNKSLHGKKQNHKVTKTPRGMSRNQKITKSMSVLEFVTSDDGGRPRVVQMQNLYDLTMDPPKEHAIPIQITTRRKDGRHVTSTTNTFEVAEAARTRASSALGINKRNRDKAKPNKKIRPSSSRSKIMSSSLHYHPVSPLPLDTLRQQKNQRIRGKNNNGDTNVLRPQTPPRRPHSAHPSDKPEAVHDQPFTSSGVAPASNSSASNGSTNAVLKSRGRTPRKIVVKSSSSINDDSVKRKTKVKVSRVQRMLSSNTHAERARTATLVDNQNTKGLDFGNYRPPLTASAPSNIEKQTNISGSINNSIIDSTATSQTKTPSPPIKRTNNFNLSQDVERNYSIGNEGNDERRIIERGNKLAATTQGRPQSSRARGIQAERARSGQRRPKLYKSNNGNDNNNDNSSNNPYYIDPRAELEETNQELRRWENEMAKLRGDKPDNSNWKENWKNDTERDFEAVFGKDTAHVNDSDDGDDSSVESYDDDDDGSIHSSVSSAFSHSSDDDGWGRVRSNGQAGKKMSDYDIIVDNDFDHEYIEEDNDFDNDSDIDVKLLHEQQQQQAQLQEFKNEFIMEDDDDIISNDDADDGDDSDAMLDENLNSTLGSEFLSLFA